MQSCCDTVEVSWASAQRTVQHQKVLLTTWTGCMCSPSTHYCLIRGWLLKGVWAYLADQMAGFVATHISWLKWGTQGNHNTVATTHAHVRCDAGVVFNPKCCHQIMTAALPRPCNSYAPHRRATVALPTANVVRNRPGSFQQNSSHGASEHPWWHLTHMRHNLVKEGERQARVLAK